MELGTVCWAHLLASVFFGRNRDPVCLPLLLWKVPACLCPLPQPSAATCPHKPNAAGGLRPASPHPVLLSQCLVFWAGTSMPFPAPAPHQKNKTSFPPGRERQIWCQSLRATIVVWGIAIKESQGYISPAHGTSPGFWLRDCKLVAHGLNSTAEVILFGLCTNFFLNLDMLSRNKYQEILHLK